MSPFVFRFPADDPRFIPVATLRFVCPHHPDELLVEWCISFPDPDVYFMDEHVWNNAAPGYRQEFIGPDVSDDTKAAAALVGVSAPDALTPDGDVHHSRAILRCPRPSCGYDAQLREAEFYAKVQDALRAMAKRGITVWTVTSPDAPTGWRSVTR